MTNIDTDPHRDARPIRKRAPLRPTFPPPSCDGRKICCSTGSDPRSRERARVRSSRSSASHVQMGPSDGVSEVLISRRLTSPLFAAMVNAAASHFAEQDDVHNGSVFHPGAVVFPPALAVAQALGLFRPRLADSRRCRLRSRHSRRRISRPLALQGVPHDRHRGRRRGRRDSRSACWDSPPPRCSTHSVRGHAGGRTVGIPARRGRLEAAACCQSRRRRIARRVSRA